MSLPQKYQVDFSAIRKNVVEDGLNRLLSEFYDACVLRQFVAVFLDELQQAYDAIADMQQKRTVYEAEGVNLDALGRIVGEDRTVWSLGDNWFTFDAQGLGFDEAPVWCTNAEASVADLVEDPQYRQNIIAKAVKNHTLVGSTPELVDYIFFLLGEKISIRKTGPNEIQLLVNADISKTNLELLTRYVTDERVDEGYYFPYPATVNISSTTYYLPDNWFQFDVEGRGFDEAPLAVTAPTYVYSQP